MGLVSGPEGEEQNRLLREGLQFQQIFPQKMGDGADQTLVLAQRLLEDGSQRQRHRHGQVGIIRLATWCCSRRVPPVQRGIVLRPIRHPSLLMVTAGGIGIVRHGGQPDQ